MENISPSEGRRSQRDISGPITSDGRGTGSPKNFTTDHTTEDPYSQHEEKKIKSKRLITQKRTEKIGKVRTNLKRAKCKTEFKVRNDTR